MARMALYTFGVLHEAQGHPRVQEFWDKAPAVFESAENSRGFIARSAGLPGWGDRVSSKFYDRGKHPPSPIDHPNLAAPMTLSLWENPESAFAFVYYKIHQEALRKRKEWFRTPEWPTYVAWWVADDYVPTWEEGAGKLEYLHEHGSTPQAFNFKIPFDEKGQPIQLDRDLVNQLVDGQSQERIL